MTAEEPKTQIDIKTSDHEIRMAVEGKPFAVAWGPGVGGEWFWRLVDIETDAEAVSVESRAVAFDAMLSAAGVSK